MTKATKMIFDGYIEFKNKKENVGILADCEEFGNCCGAWAYTDVEAEEQIKKVNIWGIQAYPVKVGKEKTTGKRRITHVETKNGVVTVDVMTEWSTRSANLCEDWEDKNYLDAPDARIYYKGKVNTKEGQFVSIGVNYGFIIHEYEKQKKWFDPIPNRIARLPKQHTYFSVFNKGQKDFLDKLKEDKYYKILYIAPEAVNFNPGHGTEPRNTLVIYEVNDGQSSTV